MLYKHEIEQPIIVAVTGHSERAYIEKAFHSGMNQVLPKPVNVKVLNKIVQKSGFEGNFKLGLKDFL